jgi:hypothetical protein
MDMTIGCSHPECSKLAARQTLIELGGKRSAGEKMLVWVCNEHANHVPPAPHDARRGLVRRLLTFASLKAL